MLRRAEVAKMLPCVPAAMTAKDAINTMKSGGDTERRGRRGEVIFVMGRMDNTLQLLSFMIIIITTMTAVNQLTCLHL